MSRQSDAYGPKIPDVLLRRCGRLVLDLGLHLDPRQLMERGVLAAEESWLRSRTFWGIWSVDKEFSALVGRPSAIRDIVVTCPKPAYWEAEDFVSQQNLFWRGLTLLLSGLVGNVSRQAVCAYIF